MNKDLIVVIVAAGAGLRFNSKIPKPFLKINNKPILWYSIYSFSNLNFVKNIYAVVAENTMDIANRFKKKYLKKISKFKDFIIGGNERQDSVYNALDFINKKGNCNYIAIHDAARPFIKEEIINNIWQAALKYGAGAPGILPVDTIKNCDNNQFIINHPKRNQLTAIQTPQIFFFPKLYEAYNKIKNKNQNFTDDTEVYSMSGGKVKIVEGDNDLFKITYKKDISMAKLILRKNKILWK